ncbi:MAG TPA: hypothetical protein VIF64_09115 [Pyrinomonadaceae bacterium]|jgi:hypothetical protein
MKIPSTSLFQVLIVKAIIEAILVVSLAVFAYTRLSPPHFQGTVELTNGGISGWVVNDSAPWDRVEVQLFADGEFAASAVANQSRHDIVTAGWSTDEWHGYSFPVTSLKAGLHEARIYALHGGGDGSRKTLRLVGAPISFAVDSNGKAVNMAR